MLIITRLGDLNMDLKTDKTFGPGFLYTFSDSLECDVAISALIDAFAIANVEAKFRDLRPSPSP